ncbi:MAG: response regulator [bacterium]
MINEGQNHSDPKKAGERITIQGNEHILFVDDEKQITQTGQKILENLGYRITACTNSLNALQIFSNAPYPFDLVILDHVMPEMSGIELARELNSIRPDLPIILTTGFGGIISEKESEELGIKAYIMKPMLSDELVQTIRQVLDQKESEPLKK